MNKDHAILAAALTAAFGIAHAMIYRLYPWMTDDVWYSIHLYDYLEGIDTSFPWQGIVDTWVDHYLTDNGRLGNIILPFLLIAPKWISAAILGGFTALMAVLMQKFTPPGLQRGLGHIAMLVMSMLLITFALPWHERMFGICYGMNYIIPSAITLLILKIWLEERRTARHKWAGISLCLLLGFWHEGFSVPLGAGLGMALVTKRLWSWKRVWMIAAMLPGFIYLISSPGFFHDTSSQGLLPPLLHWAVVVKLHIPLIIYSLMLAAIAIKRHRLNLDPLAVIILTTGFVSMYINIHVLRGERPSWPSHLLASTGIIALCGNFLQNRIKRQPISWTILITIAVALLTAHFITVTAHTVTLRRGMESALAQLRRDPTATAFTVMEFPEQLPLIAWRKPTSDSWGAWNNHNLSLYFRAKHYNDKRFEKNVMIAPEPLRHARPDTGNPVPGGLPLREISGYMFVPDGTVLPSRLLVDFGPVKKITDIEYTPFVADDGKLYYMIIPRLSYFPYFFFRPKGYSDPARTDSQTMRYIFDLDKNP